MDASRVASIAVANVYKEGLTDKPPGPGSVARYILYSAGLEPSRRCRRKGLADQAMPLEGAAFYNALARKGEAQVRLELATGIYNERRAKIVSEWLHQRELERAAQVDRRRDERGEEALALTRKALRTAQEANRISAENATAARSSARSACVQARWAVWAAVVAVVAAAVAAKDDLLRLFQALL